MVILVIPFFVRQRGAVQLGTVKPPGGQLFIHGCHEIIIMMPFEQVDHLVDKNMLQAAGSFLGQLQIDPDTALEDGGGLSVHVPGVPVSGYYAANG